MTKTGIVYDERMCLHEDKTSHPEDPTRIKQIYQMLKDNGLAQRCIPVAPIELTQTELSVMHTGKYLDKIHESSSMNRTQLDRLERTYNSVYLNEHSLLAAKLSAGGVTELCSKVVSGELTNGVAVVRPPGHHAEAHTAMGFCLFNNVGVAAGLLMNKYSGLNRIVILDFDVHHGNATQNMFYQDDRVLYISLHRYDNGSFYPGTSDGSPKMIGSGKGAGFNMNIGWNTKSIGDDAYMYAFEQAIIPVIQEFDPQLVIVSAGFDCARGDPLGGLDVSPRGFSYMITQLMKFAHGKVVVALEGGYNLDAISRSMTACVASLLGDIQIDLSEKLKLNTSVIKSVDETVQAHQKYWKCFQNAEST
jgi:acetoin utilization deacetylase AcuC-like enzyme